MKCVASNRLSMCPIHNGLHEALARHLRGCELYAHVADRVAGWSTVARQKACLGVFRLDRLSRHIVRGLNDVDFIARRCRIRLVVATQWSPASYVDAMGEDSTQSIQKQCYTGALHSVDRITSAVWRSARRVAGKRRGDADAHVVALLGGALRVRDDGTRRHHIARWRRGAGSQGAHEGTASAYTQAVVSYVCGAHY